MPQSYLTRISDNKRACGQLGGWSANTSVPALELATTAFGPEHVGWRDNRHAHTRKKRLHLLRSAGFAQPRWRKCAGLGGCAELSDDSFESAREIEIENPSRFGVHPESMETPGVI